MQCLFSRFTWPLTLLALTLVAPAVHAQEAPLKTGEAVMEGYVEALGGAEAMRKPKTRVIEGEFSIPGQGIQGSMKMLQQAPSKFRLELELPGFGKIIRVTDGTKAYEDSPISGKRELTGKELEEFLIEAEFAAEANWRENYKSATLQGTEEVEGAKCYKLELTTKSDEKRTLYVDTDSLLAKRLTMTSVSPQGEIPVISNIEEYKEVDGIKIPSKTTMSMLGIQQEMTLNKINHGVDLPADTFEVPAFDE